MDVIRNSYESKTFIVDNNDNNNNIAQTESCYQQSQLIVNRIINEHANVYDAFYLFNTSETISRIKNVQNKLTRAKINYLVKCNNESFLLQLLTTLDCGFTCVSKAEIEKVLSTCLNPNKVCFMNPIKSASHIRYAIENKISKILFDTEDELHKIHRIKFGINGGNEKLELILNVGGMGTTKHGCDSVREAPKLLALAKGLNLNVAGISISLEHENLYESNIQEAREVFDTAAKLGINLSLLYIGCEFLIGDKINISNCTSIINKSLNKYFPQEEFRDVEIVCEFGGYLVESAFTLACKIVGKKYVNPTDILKKEDQSLISANKGVFYYIYEGVYTSFTISMFKQPDSVPKPAKEILVNGAAPELLPTTIWGCTCDSFDKVYNCVYLPDMEMNDWLIFPNMGSFTFCATSDFNGFPMTSIIKIIDNKSYELLVNGKKQKYFQENDFDKISALLNAKTIT